MDLKKYCFSFLIIGSCLTSIANAQDIEGESSNMRNNADPVKMIQVIPNPAYKLFQWPQDSVLKGSNRVNSDAEEVKWAKKQCAEWIDKVLDTSWLPPENIVPIFIRNEFDERDTVRMIWNCNGYNVQVSQTASIFTIKLSSIDKKDLGLDVLTKTDKARQICQKLFKNKGRRWSQDETGALIEVPIEDLSKKIVSWSFVPRKVKNLKDDAAIHGGPINMIESGVRQPENDIQSLQDRKVDNPNWDKTAHSWDYWFKRINWWNDGNSIGFYFLKIEEGSWQASYYAKFDKTFF